MDNVGLEKGRVDNGCSEDLGTTIGRKPVESSETDICPTPRLTLEEYRRECAGLTNVGSSGSMADTGQNHEVYE